MRNALAPLSVLAALLALAEAGQRLGLFPVIVPAPSAVLILALTSPGLVLGSCQATLGIALGGYALALAVTFTAAAIGVSVRGLYGPVYNTGVILQSIPVIAAAPLLALWLGTGPMLRVTIAALACQFPMLVGLMQGLRAADARQRELMHILAASRPQTLRHLLLPAALPYLFAGMKIAAPSSILGAVTAEWAGADRGVGAVMLNALFSFDTQLVWLCVVLTILLAGGAYAIWAGIERAILRGGAEPALAD